jgi:hypothetical protein
MHYVEKDCIFTFEGKEFESGGAVITPDYIVAYPVDDGKLADWHGNIIGAFRIVSKWRTPRSYVSSHMRQIEALVDGVYYTGRGTGKGMLYKGKRKAKQCWSWS